MATGRNKPRNMDYVHFTRVDNSASVNVFDGTSAAGYPSTTSMNILSKVQMISSQVVVKKIAAAIVITIISVVAVAVTVALTVVGRQSNIEEMTSSNNGTRAASLDITEAFLWISSTVSSFVSTSSSVMTTTTSASIVTSMVPPSSSCQSSEFACSNMKCISLENVCDGIPDCEDGSDEKQSCACTEHQFQCPNGQCVSKTVVCNEVYDCLDKGDERNCSDCAGFRCLSNDVCLWDRMARRCNQIFDCEDYSDEVNCPRRPDQHVCTNGVHVLSKTVCDGLDDCGDNSDEEDCVCKKDRQFPCSDQRGKCIPLTWVCDGHPDCPSGSDEESCDECAKGDFHCNDYSCVNSSMRCDGKVDCTVAGGDEDGCVELTSHDQLQVMVGGHMFPVCSDNWMDIHSTWVCKTLHSRAVVSWTSQLPSSSVKMFAVLKDSYSQPGIINFHISDACLSDTIIHVKCQNEECGQRQIDVLQSYVAGGNLAGPGKWPWVLSLAYLNKPLCGATLIDKRWAVTAAHCIMNDVTGNHDYSKTPYYFTVTAGTVAPAGQGTYTSAMKNDSDWTHPAQIVRVSNIIFHPNKAILNNGGVDWDIALLHLESDITMTNLVQPVCLPSQGQIFSLISVCYLAGWGLLSHRQHIRASQLRDTRMQLWSENRCRGNTVIGETTVNTNSTLCAGYLFGRPTGCEGDSGGPLTCLDSASGSYLLAGIVSRGSDRCGKSYPYTHSNRFVRVAMAVTWITETIRR